MLRILENVCSRLYLLEERLVEAVYNPVNVRLAYFLLTNADDSGVLLTLHMKRSETVLARSARR